MQHGIDDMRYPIIGLRSTHAECLSPGGLAATQDDHRDGGDPQVMRQPLVLQNRLGLPVFFQSVPKAFGIHPRGGGDLKQDPDLPDVSALLEKSSKSGPVEGIEPSLGVRVRRRFERFSAARLDWRKPQGHSESGRHWINRPVPGGPQIVAGRIEGRDRVGPQLKSTPPDLKYLPEVFLQLLENGKLEIAVGTDIIAPDVDLNLGPNQRFHSNQFNSFTRFWIERVGSDESSFVEDMPLHRFQRLRPVELFG